MPQLPFRRPPRARLARPTRLVLAAALLASAAVGGIPLAQPAAAVAPTVNSVAPQSGGTGGGYPIRIYGEGFDGTISDVEIGGVNATSFSKIDSELITAVVPGAGTDNDFVDVTVTDNDGTDTLVDAFFYTDATLAVSPSTGLAAGDPITVTLDGYAASTTYGVSEFNPLRAYYEGVPTFPPVPPAAEAPYVDTLAFDVTNASGDRTVNTSLSDPFNTDGQTFDPRAVCRVDQTTSNFLGNSIPKSDDEPSYAGRCLIMSAQLLTSNGYDGDARIEEPIRFSPDRTPAAAVFTTNTGSAVPTDTITITSGTNWNANPFYGSSKQANKPGETDVKIEICGIGGVATACSTTKGNGDVGMTRYIDQTFSDGSAELTGTIVVGADADNCPTCFVRVRQSRPLSGRIEATVSLDVN